MLRINFQEQPVREVLIPIQNVISNEMMEIVELLIHVYA